MQVCWFKTFMIIVIRCEVSHEVKLKAVDKSLKILNWYFLKCNQASIFIIVL